MGKKRIFFLGIAFICCIAFLPGCGNKAGTADISNIHVNLKTYRFDKDIFAIDTNHIPAGLTALRSKYPDFLDFFLDTIMAFGIHGHYNDTCTGIKQGLHEYITHKDFVNLQETINKTFPDTKSTDEELAIGFKYLKYYFPTSNTPHIIYINRVLVTSPAFCVDTGTACICLDMFLGGKFLPYQSVGIPDYKETHLRKTYIPVALFSTIYQTTYPYKMDDKTLLDRMVERGREQYFLHKVLPGLPDSVLFGFTTNQVEWCNKNEGMVYNFFIQQNFLYNKEERLIGTYVIDGPFAKGIGSATDPGKPTPGNVGTWLGYKIVSAYMARNPNISLMELITQKKEAAQVLEGANYRPK